MASRAATDKSGTEANGGRHERKRRREDEVLEASISTFHEQGYAGTSVEDIASRLGILKGSLYHYISSKEDLLFKIVSEVHADVQRILDESLGRTDLSPIDRIALYVRSQAIYNARHITRISVYYREVDRLGDERRAVIRRQRRAQHDMVTQLLTEGQESGEIDPSIDPKLTSHCVFATLVWLYTWYKEGGAITEDQVADCCVGFVLGGIAHPAGLATAPAPE
jgi:AcrR family transcriptional regulator